MKKNYLVLINGLLALVGSAIDFFAPVMILAMRLAAHEDFGSALMALISWNFFVCILAIASRWLLKDEKRIHKWIPNLFLVAGLILLLANLLILSWSFPYLESPLMWLFGNIFGKVHELTYFFYSQWVAGGFLVISGIAFLVSLKNFKAED
ncbi:hypothetical protein HMPREF9186_01606 [Streptococcus sp. F0442]|uniref:hypothetical protein n=1 Tax=Streptococcus sp. F0442 TaxID=999425 RepID=UPI0002992735|nr:hypothetical protein [Streptococcus sp. F0442]EKS17838.1 hypothetical protein HMPREF9186_01606 [Streptococcus sp. F0442]